MRPLARRETRQFQCGYAEGDTQILVFIIHQIFLLTRDWPKHVTWANIPQLTLGNFREYSPIFKTARVAKKIWRIIKTIVAIWGENMFGYLSLDIICSSQLTVFLELRSRKTVRFSEQIMSVDKYPSIFSRQMATIVYIAPFASRDRKKNLVVNLSKFLEGCECRR